MGKEAMSLELWSRENGKEYILDELDTEENNKRYARDYIPNRIEYNSPRRIIWKCKRGHSYSCEIVGRTIFDLKCPECYPNGDVLPVGTKYGCLTIVDGFQAYQDEVAEGEIERLEESKERFLRGERDQHSNVDSVDFYDRWIADYKGRKLYKCQCKCGRIQFRSQSSFLSSKHRYCTEKMSTKDFIHLTDEQKQEYLLNLCGMAADVEKRKFAEFKRVHDKNYETNYSGKIFESLNIQECVDDSFEMLTSYGDLRKKGAGTFTVYKIYKCKCYLCGKEMNVSCSQFHIDPPTQYGGNAYHGYWSGVSCDCHHISSFQWIVNKLLFENDVNYRVEKTFPGLYGVYGERLLQYDFCIFNADGSIKALIECQGEQHYKPVEKFGGNKQFQDQIENDALKRQYAEDNGIKLIEISYKCKKIDIIESILRKAGIL